jgi:ubiquinone/menaquinone biosynthesis C-methylase UbiE
MMGIDFGPGFHARAERPVDIDAYDQYIGRWSRLFVPVLLAAVEVTVRDHVLDVATGPGESAAMALSVVGGAGLVVGADISRTMVDVAWLRLKHLSFLPVATDGQALPFKDGCFDAVVCPLGLQFFPDPARGLSKFRRVLRTGKRAAVCVPSTADRIPMWGALSDTLSYYFPDQRDALHLTFALADAERLEHMFATAGFSDVLVKRETRRGVIDSFDDYWATIEAAVGMMPQAYRALPEPKRRSVRQEVEVRLSEFVSQRGIDMSVEMLIAAGRL